MLSSKNKILFFIFFILIFATSCQTKKVFEIRTNEELELNVIKINPDRIRHECYFMNASDENQWRHQYFMHLLDDKNEVIMLLYPVNQDIDSCTDELRKIDKILKTKSQISICARDLLIKDLASDVIKTYIDFGALGKHASPYTGLTFDTVCNDHECYSIGKTWTYTCEDPEFINAKKVRHRVFE